MLDQQNPDHLQLDCHLGLIFENLFPGAAYHDRALMRADFGEQLGELAEVTEPSVHTRGTASIHV